MKTRTLVLLGSLAVLAGCSNYYQVSDPSTGKTYYTRVITDRSGGAIAFEDHRTGKDVVLQTSEVVKIDKDVFEAQAEGSGREIIVQPAAGRPNHEVQIEPRSDSDIRIESDKEADVKIKVD